MPWKGHTVIEARPRLRINLVWIDERLKASRVPPAAGPSNGRRLSGAHPRLTELLLRGSAVHLTVATAGPAKAVLLLATDTCMSCGMKGSIVAP